MKKQRVLCWLLALLMALSVLAGTIWAEPEAESTAGETTGETSADETAQPEDPAAEPAVSYQDYTALLSAGEYEANCRAALLVERNTGIVIYAKNADERVYPASLTKIMTCLVAIELCAEQGRDLDELITVTSSAYDGLDEASSSAGIQPGDQISFRELFYCVMLESANEGCNVLAEELLGNPERFVERMNARAQELGCRDTHFVNTHGLHDPDHYSTAHDLAIITEAAMACELYPGEFPDGIFYTICTADTYNVTAENYSGERLLASTNYLIRQGYPEYYYSKARGVKTGYTSAAGRCLISTARDGGLSLLGVVLGAEDDDYAADGLRYRSFVEMKKLFEYGFDNFEFVQALSELDFLPEVPVSNAKGRGSVVLRPAASVDCLLMKDYDKEKITVEWALDDDASSLEAPLSADQAVGVVTVSYDGVEIARTQLLTYTAVERETDVANAVGTALSFMERYWWVIPLLIGLIVLLIIVLIVRNLLIRRRRSIERRRRRAAERRRDTERQDPW